MISSDRVKAYTMIAGLGVAGYLAWRAYKGAGAVGESISAGLESLAAMPGRALDAVQAGASAIGVNYAQDLPPVQPVYNSAAINAAARWDNAIVESRGGWATWGNYTDNPTGKPYAATDDERAWEREQRAGFRGVGGSM